MCHTATPSLLTVKDPFGNRKTIMIAAIARDVNRKRLLELCNMQIGPSK